MSALPPIADIGTQSRNVRFVPKADSCSAASNMPFDRLVRGRGRLGGASREMGMMRLGLFAVGVLSLTVTSAWAFSQQIVSPDGGNYSFGDQDKQPTTSDNQNSSQGARPFGSNPVVQFGVQQGPVSSFGQ